MATIQQRNLVLWRKLRDLYDSRIEAEQARRRVLDGMASGPQDNWDPLYREALGAAMARQDGMIRHAEAERILADAMINFWEYRTGEATGPDASLHRAAARQPDRQDA